MSRADRRNADALSSMAAAYNKFNRTVPVVAVVLQEDLVSELEAKIKEMGKTISEQEEIIVDQKEIIDNPVSGVIIDEPSLAATTSDRGYVSSRSRRFDLRRQSQVPSSSTGCDRRPPRRNMFEA